MERLNTPEIVLLSRVNLCAAKLIANFEYLSLYIILKANDKYVTNKANYGPQSSMILVSSHPHCN